MMKKDILPRILITLHALLNARHSPTRCDISTLLFIAENILEDPTIEVVDINEEGVESPTVNISLNILKNMHLIKEDNKGIIHLTSKGSFTVNDLLSSRKMLSLWKITYYLSKFSRKTLISLASYIHCLITKKYDKQQSKFPRGFTSQINSQMNNELIEYIKELFDALKDLVRKNSLKKPSKLKINF